LLSRAGKLERENFVFDMQFSLFEAVNDAVITPRGAKHRSDGLIEIVIFFD
jgi:hypothetical protein